MDKLTRVVRVFTDEHLLDMRVVAEPGNLFVARNAWHSWEALFDYLRRFDPAVYDLKVRVHVPADRAARCSGCGGFLGDYGYCVTVGCDEDNQR